MNDNKGKILTFIKNYISLIISAAICIVFISIDLIAFEVNDDPKIVVPKMLIYLFISTTISSLLRYQGLIYGNAEPSFVETKKEYNKTIESLKIDKLEDWCEMKNNIRREQLIRKKLKFAKLNYEDFENGKYELINKEEKKKYSKRQLKIIHYCNNLEINIYDSDFLTKDIENENNRKQLHISQSSYLKNKAFSGVFTGLISSIAFAYLAVSLAKDISWANVFYSLIKVITWLGSGVVSLIFSYIFITITYKEILNDKTIKLKEYSEWYEKNNKLEKEEKNNEWKIKLKIL